MSSRLPLPFVLAACLLLLGLPTCAAAEALRIDDPVTDNYKASYNADPSRPELRTWFAARAILAAGTSWTPAAGGSIEVRYGGSVTLHGDDGRTASLSASIVSGPADTPAFRVDPSHVESGGRWGMLATVQDRAALRDTPIVVSLTLSLSSSGATLATGRVEYRHDAAFAGAAAGHIEHNGPSGRWYVGGIATRANWEPTPATRPVLVAGAAGPRITSTRLPVRTTRRFVPMRVLGRAGSARITHIRFSVAGRPFGSWRRTAPGYTIVLPRGNAVRAVRVQLRDGAGRTSQVVTRRVRCSC